MTAAWPWPGDTRVDQARRVAQSYRTALLEHAPALCAQIDDQFLRYGLDWVVPRLQTVNLDEWVTVDVAAEHTGLTVAAIYKWVSRSTEDLQGHKGNDGRLRVRLGDVLEHNAAKRRARKARRS